MIKSRLEIHHGHKQHLSLRPHHDNVNIYNNNDTNDDYDNNNNEIHDKEGGDDENGPKRRQTCRLDPR